MRMIAGTEQTPERPNVSRGFGGLGRPGEKVPIHRHPGIRGDGRRPGRLGWDVAKPVARMTVTPK